MQKALTIVTLISLLACSRSLTLTSDQVDCENGVQVFSRNAVHCAYFAVVAPEVDECPDGVSNRYASGNIVICSSVTTLTPEWIYAITSAAWPEDAGPADATTTEMGVPDSAMTNVSDGELAPSVSLNSTDSGIQ